MFQASLLSVFSILLWGFSFVFFLLYLRRRTGQKRILAEFKEEVDLIVEGIDEAADRNLMMVEERMKSLRALVDDADRRIGILNREAERRRTQERLYTELGKKPQAADPLLAPPAAERPEPGDAPPPVPLPPAPVPQGPYSPAPQAQSPSVPALQDPAVSPAAPPSGVPASPAEPRETAGGLKTRSFAEEVAALHQEGLSSEQIASRLGAPKAKVDLTLTLAKRKKTD
jgi:hypothetical protein